MSECYSMAPRKLRDARGTVSTKEGPTQPNVDAEPKGARAIIVVSVKKEYNFTGCECCCWGRGPPAWENPTWFYGGDYVGGPVGVPAQQDQWG